MEPHYRPVVIIGAPRSGTNMLRDVLTRLEGVATWPCDEINYIWRHGNVRYPSDEFDPAMATPAVRRYIRRRFDWVARRYGAHTVVEKTCANSLRVAFVDRVVPEARYVFIRRDGLDVVCSALRRWKAHLNIPYMARKARFVPLTDLPYHAGSYLRNRIYRLFSGERRLAYWGPRLEGMQALLARHPLDEVCAVQWQRCVEAAAGALSAMPAERWTEVAYEDFVADPQRELARLLAFLGLEADAAARAHAVSAVAAGSVGRGRVALGEAAVSRLEPLIRATMARYGYG